MPRARKMSEGAFPHPDPSPTGNYEQRKHWKAIQTKRLKLFRRAQAKELSKLPKNVRDLIKGTRELNRALENQRKTDG